MNQWQSKVFFNIYIIIAYDFIISFSVIVLGGLCDCCNDYRLCCYGCWCTSCLYGENAVMFDGSDYSDACWTFLAASRNPFAMMEIIKNRTALRMKYRLPEEPCDDCLVMSCCTPCAVCQATRELKYRISLPSECLLLLYIRTFYISISILINDYS